MTVASTKVAMCGTIPCLSRVATADLVTRAACCLYLPLTATRSERDPTIASPPSLQGEGAKEAPWQYLHKSMVLVETVYGWCWPK